MLKYKPVVLRKMLYKGTPIYILHFSNVFQYLFADEEKNIYQNHITLTAQKKNKGHFTVEEIEQAEQILLSGAMDSIDKLLEGKMVLSPLQNGTEN